MNRITREDVERKLESYRRHDSWTYRVTCLDPIVVTAFPNTTSRREIVPFHICNFEAWMGVENLRGNSTGEFSNGVCKTCKWVGVENLRGKSTGEFYKGVCKTCGLEYKPAAIIEQIWKLKA